QLLRVPLQSYTCSPFVLRSIGALAREQPWPYATFSWHFCSSFSGQPQYFNSSFQWVFVLMTKLSRYIEDCLREAALDQAANAGRTQIVEPRIAPWSNSGAVAPVGQSP